jgi:hypothetical protein
MAKQKPKPQKKTSSLALPAVVAVAALVFLGWVLMRQRGPQPAMSSPAPIQAPVSAAPQPQPTLPMAVATAGDDQMAAVPRMTVQELKNRMDANEVVVIDVRDIQTYMASHIPGSLHIPLVYIHGELPYLPRDKPIVTYCT